MGKAVQAARNSAYSLVVPITMIHTPCPLYPPKAEVVMVHVRTTDCAGFVREYSCDTPTEAILAASTFLAKRWTICLFRELANAAETALQDFPLFEEPSPLFEPWACPSIVAGRWMVQTQNCAGLKNLLGPFETAELAGDRALSWMWGRRLELLFKGIANCAIYHFRASQGTSPESHKNPPYQEK